MGSRLRENPDKIFELFVEIARPTGQGEDPFVLQYFPPNYDDNEVLKSIPKFAFPCSTESNVVDHFTFVLTDIDSKFKFCFCRHGTTGAQTCLCIVSHLPWFDIFYKLLNHLAEVTNRTEYCTVEPLLQVLHQQEVPDSLESVDVVAPNFKDHFSFISPDDNQLAHIPESRNLTEYYNAVDTNNMMIMFASMLNERRVLITSKKLSRLTACVHGSAALLYPMHWQHLYIPVLPPHLIDYCSAPMPYLIGIHATLMEKAQSNQELGDAVILDADNNTVMSEYDDLGALPPEVVAILKKHLKSPQSEKTRLNLMGDGLARAFLRALVALIGGYREALKIREGELITFDADAFIQTRSISMQPFLRNMLQLQIFEQFINERLELLNTGQGFSDVFEDEANVWADKSGSQSKYREWSVQMKKQGKKIRREGREKWTDFTSKVRDKSKKAYKDIRSRLDDLRKEEEGVSPSRGIPLGSSDIQRARPARPPPPDLEQRLSVSPQHQQSLRRRSYEKGGRQYKVLDVNVDDVGPHSVRRLASDDLSMTRKSRRLASDDSDLLNSPYERISVGLMDDPDIQSVFKRSFSMEDITRLREEEDYSEDDMLEEAYMVDVDQGAMMTMHAQPTHSESSSPIVQAGGLHVPRGRENRQSRDSSLSSSPARGPSPIARPRPSTPGSISQGSNHSATGTDIVPLPKPIPAKRRTSASTVTLAPSGENLIKLDEKSPAVGPITIHRKISAPAGSSPVMPSAEPRLPKHFESDFDPFQRADNRSLDSLDSSLSNLSQRSEDGDESTDISRRPSLSRNNAFYKGQRPPSIKRKGSMATEATEIKDARKNFIESHTSNPSLSNDLEMFDPLLTGQIVVDSAPLPVSTGSNTSMSSGSDTHEESLLKEWNLDFGKMRLAPNRPPPPVAPKPPSMTPSPGPTMMSSPMMPQGVLMPQPASHVGESAMFMTSQSAASPNFLSRPASANFPVTSPGLTGSVGVVTSPGRTGPVGVTHVSPAATLASPNRMTLSSTATGQQPLSPAFNANPLMPHTGYRNLSPALFPASTQQSPAFQNYNQPNNRKTLPASLAYLPQPYHAPMSMIPFSKHAPLIPQTIPKHPSPRTLNNNEVTKDTFELLQFQQSSANRNIPVENQTFTTSPRTLATNTVTPSNQSLHPVSPKANWEQFD